MEMGIIIEQRHKFIQNEPIAVFEGVGMTSCLALSPDGTQIVIGTDGGKCLILDATTGAQLATSEPHSDYDYDRICSVAFCPDGSRIVSGSVSGTVQITDATTGSQLFKFSGDSDINYVAFLLDGSQVMSFSYDGALRIWDARTGIKLHQFQLADKGVARSPALSPDDYDYDRICSVAFCPDGSRIVSGSVSGTVQITDATTGSQLFKFSGDSDINYVAFLLDGSQVMSFSYDGALRIWDARTGIKLHQFQLADKGVARSPALSPDGTKIALYFHCDRRVGIWYVTTGQQVGDCLGSNNVEGKIVTFSPDGAELFTVSHDNDTASMSVWEVSTGSQVAKCTWSNDNEEFGTSSAFSPNGSQFLLSSNYGSVTVFDLPSCRHSRSSLQWHNDLVWGIAFSPDGSKIVSGSEDGTIKIWDTTATADINSDRNGVHSLAFGPDGTTVLLVESTGNLQICDAISGDRLGGFQGEYGRAIKSVVFSVDRTKIGVVFYDGRVRIWDGITAMPLHNVQIREQSIQCIVFSPDASRLALGTEEGTVNIWDVTQGRLIYGPLRGHVKWIVMFLQFSSDGTEIMAGNGDGSIDIWDAEKGILLDVQQYHGGFMAISPDGTKIAVTSRVDYRSLYLYNTATRAYTNILTWDSNVKIWDRIVRFSPNGTQIIVTSHSFKLAIWDVSTGLQLGHIMESHRDNDLGLSSVAFSPDGTRIISGYLDWTIRMWDAATGTQLGQPLRGHDADITCVAFSSDGSKIVSGSEDSTVRIWDVAACMQLQNGHPNLGQASALTVASFNNDNKHENWTLTDDGWIKFPGNPNPIVWIPPSYRKHLWTPGTKCIISSDGYTKLSFRDCVYGENWARCIEDNQLAKN
ncbi:hypothetical protein GYMLUDRAFT_251391 [Collybiopsis luxurians FD-317 M1]|uniref:Pyrrolo-quinoline quinone repeat domain-containing protein n=1 Tax=Collybiopsis luxurians FD-317 M1 TaxID=944289 RepID=A0A0D0CBJ2_9AGAR|nr:hypothetical protein GYMLUDRAFT_251391 [Collybiopsis luxurians FD-317 M1]